MLTTVRYIKCLYLYVEYNTIAASAVQRAKSMEPDLHSQQRTSFSESAAALISPTSGAGGGTLSRQSTGSGMATEFVVGQDIERKVANIRVNSERKLETWQAIGLIQ